MTRNENDQKQTDSRCLTFGILSWNIVNKLKKFIEKLPQMREIWKDTLLFFVYLFFLDVNECTVGTRLENRVVLWGGNAI